MKPQKMILTTAIIFATYKSKIIFHKNHLRPFIRILVVRPNAGDDAKKIQEAVLELGSGIG